MSRSLGLDVGGSAIKLAVLDGHDVVHRDRVPLPAGPVLPGVIEVGRRSVDRFVVDTVGVGVAGLVTYPAGELVWGPHLPDRAVPYRTMLSEAFGFDVPIDNDANLAAVAEHTLGAGEGSSPLVVVTLGSGIGVGIVTDGRVFRGAGYAGELGHMPMVGGGDRCSCGLAGCWETLVSGTRLDALARELAQSDPSGPVAREAGRHEPTGSHLVDAARSGDTEAIGALSVVGEWLGRGLVTLVLAYDPELIVIGGAAAASGPLLLDDAAEALAAGLSGAAFRSAPPVVATRLGGFAGAVGAALVGRHVHNGVHDW